MKVPKGSPAISDAQVEAAEVEIVEQSKRIDSARERQRFQWVSHRPGPHVQQMSSIWIIPTGRAGG